MDDNLIFNKEIFAKVFFDSFNAGEGMLEYSKNIEVIEYNERFCVYNLIPNSEISEKVKITTETNKVFKVKENEMRPIHKLIKNGLIKNRINKSTK